MNQTVSPQPKKIIRLFRVDSERQQKVFEQIKTEARPDLDFFVLSIFSGIIITLGIIINSGAIIIGGMLLAPLVWPILAGALGIIKGSSNVIERSLFNLIKATILVLVVACLIGLFSPLKEIGSEMASRTRPTLFELFIALAAGFVAAYIISFPKLGSAIAGVMVAAAIVPPICVMGLSFAYGDLAQAGGAFLLYITNLIAATLGAYFLFALAKFKAPQTEAGKERRTETFVWLVIFLVIITIPLVIITRGVIKENRQDKIVRETITINLPKAQLTETTIKEVEGILTVEAVIRSSGTISQDKVKELSDILSAELGGPVLLKITLVPVLEAGETTLSPNTWPNNQVPPANNQQPESNNSDNSNN